MSATDLLRTPLFELHLELGAKMVPFAGYAMPLHYAAGLLKEHLHTRSHAGLFDVSHMGQLAVRARDPETAARALEALVPIDLLGLVPGRQRYGFLTNATGGTWDFAIGRLRENYPPAVRLLQLCSYFSPEPISMDLLEGVEIARTLGGNRTVSRAYQELSRFALIRVDRKARSVQVHRLVQLSMRNSMTEQEQREARETVYRALVAARPGKDDPEDPNTWDQYRILWPHLGTPWAMTTPDDGVRELLVDRVADRLADLGFAEREEVELTREDVYFRLPARLR